MNRRSPPAPATITGEEITNFYQVMPSKFKPVIKNPNKHLHGFDLPFRLIVCAPSGSGKTNFVANLLQLFSAGEGSFTDILVLTKNSDEPIYNYLKEKAKGIVIKEGLGNNLPNLDKTEEKEDQKLIVLDDLVLEKIRQISNRTLFAAESLVIALFILLRVGFVYQKRFA